MTELQKKHYPAVLSLALALLLGGCFTPFNIAPNEDWFEGAMLRLTDEEREVVSRGFDFKLDLSIATIVELPRPTTRNEYDFAAFQSFFNSRLSPGAERVAVIDELRIQFRLPASFGTTFSSMALG